MHNFSTDQPRRHQRYIVIGVLSALIYLAGIQFFGPVIGFSIGLVSTLLYFIFTKYLWKWEWLHDNGLVAVPNLNGHWGGYLYTSRDPSQIDEELIVTDGRQIDGLTKMKTDIQIEQTWDTIRISLDGPESPSHSRGATILVNEKAWPTLTYNYLNEGSRTNEELNAHYGTAALEYHEDEDKLEGKYYNRPDQRGTHGVLELYRTD